MLFEVGNRYRIQEQEQKNEAAREKARKQVEEREICRQLVERTSDQIDAATTSMIQDAEASCSNLRPLLKGETLKQLAF